MTTNLSRDEQLRGRQNVRHAMRNFTSELLVFHNPKLNLEEMNDLYDRPIDIVLLHKTKGLMGLAIKSGEIVEESGDLVSQYQPAKQYYKIIDPIKQAQKAMLSLLDECDPALKDFVPITVVVIYPDTHKSEFTRANPLFLFEEDLVVDDLQGRLQELFSDSWDAQKTQKYWANCARIKEYLKLHSDNNIERVERKETLTKLGVREEKKPYQLPQKAAPGSALKSPAPARSPGAVRVQTNAVIPKSASVKSAAQQPSPASSKLKSAPLPVAARKSADLTIQPAPNPLSQFIQNIEDRWKNEEQVELSGGQWGMVIAIAAIFICVAYFIGRNAGIIMHMR